MSRESRIPFLWLALSLAWLAVIVVADIPAWPLVIWLAVTIAPVQMRFGRRATADR